MEQGTPRSVAHERALFVLESIESNIAADPRVSITAVASAVGMAPATLYRWLKKPPDRIDVIQTAAVADWLHDHYGHANFATLWLRASSRIQ